MLDKLLKSVAAQGRSVLMISHDLPRSLQLADRVTILSHGKIAYDSPTKKFIACRFCQDL